MISVYSLDGNSIFEVAKRFERLGIEQLAKTPQETSERIKSGQDTGSSKWLSDFNNLYGLANQLKVKRLFSKRIRLFLNNNWRQSIFNIILTTEAKKLMLKTNLRLPSQENM